jgi:hypothetical protein
MSDITFDVPNLDDASTEYADYDRLTGVLKLLAEYSENKALAMYSRRVSADQQALALEARNDRIYQQLPEWARW